MSLAINSRLLSIVLASSVLCGSFVASNEVWADAQTMPSSEKGSAYIGGEKDFEDMSKAEKDAAKAAAKFKKIETLRVCADPGNLPFSDKNGQGYENKIAEVLAKAMGAKLSYAWRPTFERGLTRQPMSELNLCDVMLGMPTEYESLLMTMPMYRSTYVFVSRKDKKINLHNLDDPVLKKLRIGVYETSGIRNALANHGIKSNIQVMAPSHDADLVPEHQPWHQVEQVVKGELDLAGVWGPFAGWVKVKQNAPIVIQATNLMDDIVPMEFSIAVGVRKYDAVLKYALENAMEAKRQEIAKILSDYGVPLVQCSDCVIAGTLPAHGDYNIESSFDQSTEHPIIRSTLPLDTVEKWLADGADVNDELDNAVLAADLERAAFLLNKGADVNQLSKDGSAPLHIAVNNGDNPMITLLLDHHANINVHDRDGFTPLSLAAAWNRTPAVVLLASRGANLEDPIPGGYSPLFVAVGGGKFAAAKALMDAGAKVDIVEGPQSLTLLMAVATQKLPERRIVQVMSKIGPTDIAQELIRRGVDVNAVSSKGVSALMIAAARDNAPIIGLLAQANARLDNKSAEGQTALDIAKQNGNDSAVRALQLFQK